MFTANGGVVANVLGMQVEILSHKFHNPYTDIVCAYFKDHKTGGVTEVTYYEHIDGSVCGSEVYKFKAGNTQHYWSRNYAGNSICATKYNTIAYKLRECFRAINFNQFDNRDLKVNKEVDEVLTIHLLEICKTYRPDILHFNGVMTGVGATRKLERAAAFDEDSELTIQKLGDKQCKFKNLDLVELRVILEGDPVKVDVQCDKEKLTNHPGYAMFKKVTDKNK